MMLLSHSRISQAQFIQVWQKQSYNSGAAAAKAMKKYNVFLQSIDENDESIMQKLLQIKNSEEFYLFLNRIVGFFSQSISPRSVNLYFSFVKDYFRKNGFRIYREDVKQFVSFPKVQKERKVPLLMEQLEILTREATQYMRGAIYVLASSGMRSSEFLQVKEDDIKWDLDPVEVHLRSEITKTKVDRVTYLSPQAVDNFPKIKPYDPETSLVYFEENFAHLRKKCGLDGKYRNSNIHHVTPHRIRAFFKTEASNMHGKDYAEDLIGHEGYLSTYYAISYEERAQKYKQLVPKITI